MRDVKQVTVCLNRVVHYHRAVLRGITRYARAHGPWEFFLPWVWGRGPSGKPPGWRDDGILGELVPLEGVTDLLMPGRPAVNVSSHSPAEDLPGVLPDNHCVGRLAAEHFLDRGFKHFGFVGAAAGLHSVARRGAFEATAAEAGHACSIFDAPPPEREPLWRRWRDAMGRWLRALPKPAGVLTATDDRGWDVLETCRACEILVPEQLAVVGVDNDPLLAPMATPPLSSVETDAERIGFEAAAMLAGLMAGQAPARRTVLVPPTRVVTRQSSDTMATGDSQIATAVRFIRDHVHQPIKVEDVLADMTISRRSLERRFQRHLGRSPHDEISRTRIERARQLLAETDLAVQDIALKSGFKYLSHLHEVFKRRTGLTPNQYRRQFRS